MLVHAAIEAVKQWKYKPYLLEGEPVEVETTVQVNFWLAGWLAARPREALSHQLRAAQRTEPEAETVQPEI